MSEKKPIKVFVEQIILFEWCITLRKNLKLRQSEAVVVRTMKGEQVS